MSARIRPWLRPASIAVAMALILMAIWMVDWRWMATAAWVGVVAWILTSTDLPHRTDSAGAHLMDHLLHSDEDEDREPVPLRPDSASEWPDDEDDEDLVTSAPRERHERSETRRDDPFAA